MLKNLVKIASDLDDAGFKKEADIVDLIIKRVAASIDDSDVIEEEYEDGIPTGMASSSDLDEILGSEVSDEERAFYERLQEDVLNQEEDDDSLSEEDVEEFWSRQQSGY
jgi:hypothetical protein